MREPEKFAPALTPSPVLAGMDRTRLGLREARQWPFRAYAALTAADPPQYVIDVTSLDPDQAHDTVAPRSRHHPAVRLPGNYGTAS